MDLITISQMTPGPIAINSATFVGMQLAGLPGAAFAMYRCAKPENRKKVASLLIPAVFTLAMVGISEPIEYTFLFVAPALYWLVYAPLCGLCYVLAEVFKISINGTALFFMIPNLFQPQKVHAMAAIWLLPVTTGAVWQMAPVRPSSQPG